MDFAQRTIDLARQNVTEGGRPFATVIVRDGEILAESANKVAQSHDPTAHAEILAIRAACVKLGTEHLTGATIYVLAHPCPMCLGSLYYCSPDQVVFLTQRDQYEPTTSTTANTSSWPRSTTSSARTGRTGDCRCATTPAMTRSRSTASGANATATTGLRRWGSSALDRPARRAVAGCGPASAPAGCRRGIRPLARSKPARARGCLR